MPKRKAVTYDESVLEYYKAQRKCQRDLDRLLPTGTKVKFVDKATNELWEGTIASISASTGVATILTPNNSLREFTLTELYSWERGVV